MEPSPSETIAAIDLGSNSFQMIVANLHDGELLIVDRLKEMIRLAAGFNDEKQLTDEAQQRALECLQRFGQRLREQPFHRTASALFSQGPHRHRRNENSEQPRQEIEERPEAREPGGENVSEGEEKPQREERHHPGCGNCRGEQGPPQSPCRR